MLRATKLAEVVLARFGVRGARLKPLRLEFAHVFRMTSRSDGAFALRMYAVPEVDEEALRADPGLRRAWGCVRRARCGRC